MLNPFTQKWVKEIQIDDVTSEQFLKVAVETSKSLGWIFSYVNSTGFTAYTNNGLFNWNAEIKLRIYDGKARIVSQSRNLVKMEFDKDETNLETFLSTFDNLKRELLPGFKPAYMSMQSYVA